jgi:hypothetical protein
MINELGQFLGVSTVFETVRSWVIPVIGVIVFFVVWRIFRGKATAKGAISAVSRVVLFPPLWLLGLLIREARRFFFIERIFNYLLKVLGPFEGKIGNLIGWYFGRVPGLLRGRQEDLIAYMNANVPNRYHPIWGVVDAVPPDLRRSFVEDGHLTVPKELLRSYRLNQHDLLNAVKAGLIAAVFAVGFLTVVAIFFPSSAPSLAEAKRQMRLDLVQTNEQVDRWVPSMDSGRSGAGEAVVDRLKAQHYAVVRLVTTPFAAIAWLVLIAWGGMALGAMAMRSYIFSILHKPPRYMPLNIILPDDKSKESIVRFKYRIEERDRDRMAFLKQLEAIGVIGEKVNAYDLSPTIRLGYCTGDFRFRGTLASPHCGQEMRISLHDLHQNMIIFGGTGAGKTRNVIKPILDQLMDLRLAEQRKPDGLKVSFYNTDSKGVLYVDVKKIAEEKGLSEDLIVIGCNPENEWAVDILDGLTPQQVADIIKSVGAQAAGGDSGDAFWVEMAATTILNFALLAYAAQRSQLREEILEERGYQPYSLCAIYALISDNEFAINVCADIEVFIERGSFDHATFDKALDVNQVADAAKYVRSQWLSLVAETKAGIMANVTKMLGGFKMGDCRIRDAFGSGTAKRKVTVDQFWGKLVCVNLPMQTYGFPARLINVFLKTRLFLNAVKRQSAFETRKRMIEEQLTRLRKEAELSGHPWPMLAVPFGTVLAIPNMAMVLSEEQCLLVAAYASAAKAFAVAAIGVPLVQEREEDWYRNDQGILDLETFERLQALLPEIPEDARKPLIPLMAAADEKLEELREANISALSRVPTVSDLAEREDFRRGLGEEVCTLVDEWKQLKFDLEKNKLYFVADEYQDLITMGTGAAPTDATFWNVARSTGTTGIIATQSVSALEKEIDASGDGKQTRNFLSNMRSKIILQVEDPKTLEYVKSTLVGKTSRFLTFSHQHCESYEAFIREIRRPEPFVFFDYRAHLDHIESIARLEDELSLELLERAFDVKRIRSWLADPDAADLIYMGIVDLSGKHDVGLDTRFIDTRAYTYSSTSGMGGSVTRSDNYANQLATKQQAMWRAEDKYQEYLTEGNLTDQVDLFCERDMMVLGQTHALMSVVRAGKIRQDIVEIGRNDDLA